jgi:hypothetical protein
LFLFHFVHRENAGRQGGKVHLSFIFISCGSKLAAVVKMRTWMEEGVIDSGLLSHVFDALQPTPMENVTTMTSSHIRNVE